MWTNNTNDYHQIIICSIIVTKWDKHPNTNTNRLTNWLQIGCLTFWWQSLKFNIKTSILSEWNSAIINHMFDTCAVTWRQFYKAYTLRCWSSTCILVTSHRSELLNSDGYSVSSSTDEGRCSSTWWRNNDSIIIIPYLAHCRTPVQN